MDRNYIIKITEIWGLRSLSARRAWIEIIMFVNIRVLDGVALRKESVDRNDAMQIIVVIVHVALRKESVDGNCKDVSD